MKRFTSSVVVLVLAVAALGVGLVMRHEANFAHSEVKKQLAAQAITFQPVSALQPDQKTVSCLVANANKPLVTGQQAECYADYQIELDIKGIFGNNTYAALAAPARQAAYAAAYMAAKDPTNPKLASLQADAAKAEAPAGVVFQGETLRGMLLTTYAFDHMGDLGSTTANILFVLTALLLVTSVGLAAVKARKPNEVAPPTAA